MSGPASLRSEQGEAIQTRRSHTGLLRSAMCRSLAITDGDGFCLEIGYRPG
ncbi:MAG: hypothetical protein LBT00_16180 [Spirochaetaceae bacterium]|nr:hypothetical protein [Spirochaetaceae bacterium]